MSCLQTVIDALVMHGKIPHIYIDIRTLADIREHILVRRRVHSWKLPLRPVFQTAGVLALVKLQNLFIKSVCWFKKKWRRAKNFFNFLLRTHKDRVSRSTALLRNLHIRRMTFDIYKGTEVVIISKSVDPIS